MSDDGKFGSFLAGYFLGGMRSPRPSSSGVRVVVILAVLLLVECVSHDAPKTATDPQKPQRLEIVHHVSHPAR